LNLLKWLHHLYELAKQVLCIEFGKEFTVIKYWVLKYSLKIPFLLKTSDRIKMYSLPLSLGFLQTNTDLLFSAFYVILPLTFQSPNTSFKCLKFELTPNSEGFLKTTNKSYKKSLLELDDLEEGGEWKCCNWQCFCGFNALF
jgi:hypothetical protein